MTELQFQSTFKFNLIYAFTIKGSPRHQGLLKIGVTSFDLEKGLRWEDLTPNHSFLREKAIARIKQIVNTSGLEIDLMYVELAIKKGKHGGLECFRDNEVHRVLINSGITQEKMAGSTAREWFRIELAQVVKAIASVKNNEGNLGANNEIVLPMIEFREEQEAAIVKTVHHFKRKHQMLWNAKMRFGKTLCALEVVRRLGFAQTIIITHRPVVNDAWYQEFQLLFRGEEYRYGSKNNGNPLEWLLEKRGKFIYFASLQDLRQSKKVGGNYQKNEDIFATKWDCVIVDEAHEGTKTTLGDETIKQIITEGHTRVLSLSGTPFNILDDYEADEVYTWDYLMEQERKHSWEASYPGVPNPYYDLPNLRIYTYDLGKNWLNHYVDQGDRAFNFYEFFSTVSEGDNRYRFLHEQDVRSFLDLMTKDDVVSNYPFANERYRKLFRHSLWMIPGVKEAKALKSLMLEHPVFGNGHFEIVNVAGNDDEEAANALSSVRSAIKEAEKSGRYTITLSCGKLTTGVTVKEWTAVLMLCGSETTSVSSYLQTIFRVQSPCQKDGMFKETAYVFDFAPDRTLRMVAKALSVSVQAGKTSAGSRQELGKFLNYCPIIAVDGSEMHKYDSGKLLQELKQVYADRVISRGFDDRNLYNDELLKLNDLDIQKFDQLHAIIGKQKPKNKKEIIINQQGLNHEEYELLKELQAKKSKSLTDEEKRRMDELKEKMKIRNQAITILQAISIRMPLLLYGVNLPHNEDISLDRFIEEVDEGSWQEFMPQGVTKELFRDFQKYYDEDIFIACGKKIREIVYRADSLSILERIHKITQLLANFKNPDKETVLTPWRVVNMHMAKTLGGCCFWDETYRDILATPRWVDHGEVTADIFGDPEAQILEINAKTGLYPLYIAYSFFHQQAQRFSETFTQEKQWELWGQIVQKHIFTICKTPMAKMITKRTLVGYQDYPINAHSFDDLVNQFKNKNKQIVERLLRANYWKRGDGKMNFKAVVGNPPYQEESLGMKKAKKSVYHHFIDVSMKLAPKSTLITPARFLFNTGDTPKEWNQKILQNQHFKIVKRWVRSDDLFDTVDIKGGVVITYHDLHQQFSPIGVFTEFVEMKTILAKVQQYGETSLMDIIYNQNKFHLANLYADFPELQAVISSNGRERRMTSGCLKYPCFREEGGEADLRILGLLEGKRCYRYISPRYVEDDPQLGKYKVIVPANNGSGAIGEVLSTPMIGEPMIGYTQTFISIGSFTNLTECQAALKYIKTKFCRMMLGVAKVTQNGKREAWKYVPVQDFSSNSEIDWSLSVAEIDQQLYRKYQLTGEEIAFIEVKVRSMI